MIDHDIVRLAEAWQRMHARSPEQRRADIERLMLTAAQIEIGGGLHAKFFGQMRRKLASELFVGRITDQQ